MYKLFKLLFLQLETNKSWIDTYTSIIECLARYFLYRIPGSNWTPLKALTFLILFTRSFIGNKSCHTILHDCVALFEPNFITAFPHSQVFWARLQLCYIGGSLLRKE